MKVYIWEDEAYPVYGIDTDLTYHSESVEIPEDLYQDYLKIEKEYERVQNELQKLSCE